MHDGDVETRPISTLLLNKTANVSLPERLFS